MFETIFLRFEKTLEIMVETSITETPSLELSSLSEIQNGNL